MNTKIKTLENKMIVEENERYVEIYKIICLNTNKIYVGQAVSHILNNGKYRRYGMKKRLNGHISEAYSNKKNQCHYLNNAIKKYGKNNFIVELLDVCELDKSDDIESYYIQQLNSMFPYGYNLKLGTKTTYLSDEGRKRVSNGVYNYYKDKKFEKFKDIKNPLDDDIDKYIKPFLIAL